MLGKSGRRGQDILFFSDILTNFHFKPSTTDLVFFQQIFLFNMPFRNSGLPRVHELYMGTWPNKGALKKKSHQLPQKSGCWCNFFQRPLPKLTLRTSREEVALHLHGRSSVTVESRDSDLAGLRSSRGPVRYGLVTHFVGVIGTTSVMYPRRARLRF